MEFPTRSAVVLGLSMVLGGCGLGDALAQERETDQELRERQIGTDVPAVVDTSTAASLSQTFRAAAATALPSVVAVQVTKQPERGRQGMMPFPFGTPPQGELPPQMGTGSGFVYTDQGHVVTNNHVVEGATEISVQFPDGRIYDDVEVVGRDPNSDIAVIKLEPIDGDDFVPLEIANSDRVQVGDWVIALGNPLDLGFTVTAGIVSAKGRNLGIIPGEMALESFIQTDAAINRGNSGGPLVDLFGRVVGVNTAIYSQTGMYAGNGFAVPSAIAVKTANDIIEYGFVRRPQLGVRISAVTEAQAEVYGLDRIQGAFVSEVVRGGPAADAGIRPEDIIVSLEGRRVQDSADLISRLARMEPGEAATLGLVRDGRERTVEVELGEFAVERPEPREREVASTPESLLGIQVASIEELPPRAIQGLGLEDAREGVVVTNVQPTGPSAGQLEPGDVILEFNREPVETPGQLQRLVRDVEPGDAVVIRVLSRLTGNEAVRTYRLR